MRSFREIFDASEESLLPFVKELMAFVMLTTLSVPRVTLNFVHIVCTRFKILSSINVILAFEKNGLRTPRAERCMSWDLEMAIMSNSPRQHGSA
jgi:hypothetical protein